MCGIVGIFSTVRPLPGDFEAGLRRMTRSLSHRGPDAEGFWVDPALRLAIGHRRLSILDLTSCGNQPMTGPSSRFVVAFNGEIYNHAEIGSELRAAGRSFRGHSDTEVLVTALETWGVDGTLERLVGMFAFAAWDALERVLYLARDRMGEKPLYYGQIDGNVVFASELKVLRHAPMTHEGSLDQRALSLYFRYGYVPAPFSIFKGVFKLPPGCVLVLDEHSDLTAPSFSPFPGADADLKPRRYWDLRERASALIGTGFGCLSPDEYVTELDRRMRVAIEGQMIADVPVGAFLSGGIDSSAVTAIMQSLSDTPIDTFTIGFDEREFNEADHAAAIARHLGTHHTTLVVNASMALGVVPQLGHIYDEPFADSSQIPTTLLCRLARQHVTVSLSGDAGDELFGGYNRYLYSESLASSINRYPRAARLLAGAALGVISPGVVHHGIRSLRFLNPKFSLGSANAAGRVTKLRRALRSDSTDEMYEGLLSYWEKPGQLLSADVEDKRDRLVLPEIRSGGSMDRMMAWDLGTYLPDDNLVKVDRAAMFSSLETRLPLLDHRVVELALQLPARRKVVRGSSKWPLRQVLDRYVPTGLVDRPKMGFSVPVAAWLRGELRDWAEELLSPNELQQSGMFLDTTVRATWEQHISGRRDHSMKLWTVLMFQAWRQANI